MLKTLGFFFLIWSPILPRSTSSLASTTTHPVVDLHAHLFFHEGVGLSWLGSFEGPLVARSWDDRLSSKVNVEALENSGVGIVIAALYTHPLFIGSQRESLRRQIAEARKFVASHPNWIIARSPEEASLALDAGKRVMILSIEGASGTLETEADLKEFIDQEGIRIVTPLHFTDDEFGGAAFMPGIKILTNPWAAVKSLLHPKKDAEGVRTNSQGLKKRGTELIQALIDRGVWIDLSHSSDRSEEAILPLLARSGQPLLYTHIMLRGHYRGERAISRERLEQVKNSRGIIGILPSDDMLGPTAVPPELCPSECSGECSGGAAAFLAQFKEASAVLTPHSVMIGSDINAPLSFLQPSCEASERRDPHGFWTYAQLFDLWKMLRDYGLLGPDPDRVMIDRFLEAWREASRSVKRRSE